MKAIRCSIGFALLLLVAVCHPIRVVGQDGIQTEKAAHSIDSLAEVRDKHRALLVVFRSGILNANDGDSAIIEQVLKADPHPRGRYQWAYGQIAKKLNSYIRKYNSLTAAHELSDADYVIYFNLIEYRRILNTIYPYGELFVIVKGSPETQTPPRVVWKAKKILWAADAIGDLIKELKMIRGET
jgi:hypothetical protein